MLTAIHFPSTGTKFLSVDAAFNVLKRGKCEKPPAFSTQPNSYIEREKSDDGIFFHSTPALASAETVFVR